MVWWKIVLIIWAIIVFIWSLCHIVISSDDGYTPGINTPVYWYNICPYLNWFGSTILFIIFVIFDPIWTLFGWLSFLVSVGRK